MAALRTMSSRRIIGSPSTALAKLDQLIADSGADEIMVSTIAYGLETRVRSLELLAGAWSPPAG